MYLVPLIRVFRKMVLENSKKEVVVGDGRIVGSLDLREVAKGFVFPTLPMINSTDVVNFKKERKAHTYVRVHHHAFGCDPIYGEVKW